MAQLYNDTRGNSSCGAEAPGPGHLAPAMCTTGIQEILQDHRTLGIQPFLQNRGTLNYVLNRPLSLLSFDKHYF